MQTNVCTPKVYENQCVYNKGFCNPMWIQQSFMQINVCTPKAYAIKCVYNKGLYNPMCVQQKVYAIQCVCT